MPTHVGHPLVLRRVGIDVTVHQGILLLLERGVQGGLLRFVENHIPAAIILSFFVQRVGQLAAVSDFGGRVDLLGAAAIVCITGGWFLMSPAERILLASHAGVILTGHCSLWELDSTRCVARDDYDVLILFALLF